jgi:hypothetical protein
VVRRKTTLAGEQPNQAANQRYFDSDEENDAVVVKKAEEKPDLTLDPRTKQRFNRENQRQNLTRIKIKDMQYKVNLIRSIQEKLNRISFNTGSYA